MLDETDAYEAQAHQKLRGVHGLYVAMLTREELEAFDYLCRNGHASRDYSGTAGVLGVAKVKVHTPDA